MRAALGVLPRRVRARADFQPAAGAPVEVGGRAWARARARPAAEEEEVGDGVVEESAVGLLGDWAVDGRPGCVFAGLLAAVRAG
jgi:hypothetical protein